MCLATPFAIHCLQWTAWQHKHAASCLATFYLSSKTREDNNNNCSEATKPVYSHQHTHTHNYTPPPTAVVADKNGYHCCCCCCCCRRISNMIDEHRQASYSRVTIIHTKRAQLRQLSRQPTVAVVGCQWANYTRAFRARFLCDLKRVFF